MDKINTEPLSGMRDFLPLDVLRRDYVIDTIKRVYQRYGFEPLETPTMERLSTLLGKYGDEGDQLIFRVLKRGEKLEKALQDDPTENSVADAGLRYDLTVPLARVMAEYRSKLPRFFKRYQIQPVYRADRPAKGRYREFYQCDVDIVGSKSKIVEAEVLAAGAEVLEALGFHGQGSFTLRLNHRGILRGLMQVAGVPADAGGRCPGRHRQAGQDRRWRACARSWMPAALAPDAGGESADNHGRRTHRQRGDSCLAGRPAGRDGTRQPWRRRTQRSHRLQRWRPGRSLYPRRSLPGPWSQLLHRPDLRGRVSWPQRLRRRRRALRRPGGHVPGPDPPSLRLQPGAGAHPARHGGAAASSRRGWPVNPRCW